MMFVQGTNKIKFKQFNQIINQEKIGGKVKLKHKPGENKPNLPKTSTISKIPNTSKPKEIKMAVKQDLQRLLQIALQLIIKTQNVHIQQSTNMNADTIKALLIKAYKWVLTLNISKTDIKSPNQTPYILSIDPVYKYLFYMQFIAFYANKKNQKQYPPKITDVFRVLGQSLDDIIQNKADLYEKIQPVSPSDKLTEYAQYKYDSYSHLIEYLKNKIYLKTIIPLNPELKEYTAKYEKMQSIYEKYRKMHKYLYIHPFIKNKWINTTTFFRNQFLPNDLILGKIYCPNGQKHDFSIYVYITKSKQKEEYTLKTIKSWLDSSSPANVESIKRYKNLEYFDKKCSKCNQYQQNASSEGLEDKLLKLSKKDDFYIYYDIRCPVSELHEFSEKGGKTEQCIKCGITMDDKTTKSDIYFKKYKSIFDDMYKEKTEFVKMELNNILQAKKLRSRDQTQSNNTKQYPQWNSNIYTQNILEWAKLVGKNYNTLTNIGLSEKVKYEYIEQEKKNPYAHITESEYKARNIKIKAYIMQIFRTYYLLKNSSKVYNLPPQIKKIMQEGESKNFAHLPDIYDDFDDKYKYYESTLKPIDFSNYLLSMMANLFITINQKLHKENLPKIANNLLKYLIDEIVTSEKIMSIPDPLRLVIEKSTDIPPQNTDLTSDDIVDHDQMQDRMVTGIRGIIKSEEDEPETGPIDDFSLDNLDIDTDDPEAENLVANPADF
jgi:hypothetical protein